MSTAGTNRKMLLIGGSAGSLTLISEIVNALPADCNHTVVIIIHRQKNVVSHITSILEKFTGSRPVIEPEDKQAILSSGIYLAPQNYHLLIENTYTFSLDYAELVNYCRPSIDVTFESAARVYKKNACCILLSGANSDGANGVKHILNGGGQAIIQNPLMADYPAMPQKALQQNPLAKTMSPNNIVSLVANLHD